MVYAIDAFLIRLKHTMYKELLNTEHIINVIAHSHHEQGYALLREFELRLKQLNIRKIERKWAKYTQNRWMRLL